jgi:type I restriction enzyme M protein
VIANPPFSLEHWGEDQWIKDPYGRNIAGVPPRTSGDYAWVQHMLCSMAPRTGRMAVVLPHGALFRMGVEGQIRRTILDYDMLDAVIGLVLQRDFMVSCSLYQMTEGDDEPTGTHADGACA